SAFTTQFFAAEKVVSYAKAWHGGRLTVGDAPVAAVCSPSRPKNCSASFSSPLTHCQLKAYTEAKANPSEGVRWQITRYRTPARQDQLPFPDATLARASSRRRPFLAPT